MNNNAAPPRSPAETPVFSFISRGVNFSGHALLKIAKRLASTTASVVLSEPEESDFYKLTQV